MCTAFQLIKNVLNDFAVYEIYSDYVLIENKIMFIRCISVYFSTDYDIYIYNHNPTGTNHKHTGR